MICSTAEGEPLWGMLRPGNAAANSIADRLRVLEGAIGVLPARDAAGHRRGDPKGSVQRRLLVRIDAAGCSARIAHECRNRNIGFAVTARATDGIDAAIAAARFDDSVWTTATPNPKHARKPNRTQVADLTGLVDLSDWPDRTRLIVRREPRHPGARQPRPRRHAHARPRSRRERHRMAQGLGLGTDAVRRVGRQQRLDSDVPHRAHELVPDPPAQRRSRQSRTQTAPQPTAASGGHRMSPRPPHPHTHTRAAPRRPSAPRDPAPPLNPDRAHTTPPTAPAAPPHTHPGRRTRPDQPASTHRHSRQHRTTPTKPRTDTENGPSTPNPHPHEQSGLDRCSAGA